MISPRQTLGNYYNDPAARKSFLKQVFDAGARDYDFVERLLSLGTGARYRREALRRAGLATGMNVLDVAVGTGLVARVEIHIVRAPKLVTGLDPSLGMIREAVESLGISVVLGVGEQLPFPDDPFDFVSMGYALRHLTDISRAFSEFNRVLKPGGTLCIIEITAPRHWLSRAMLRGYMRGIVPMVTRVTTGRPQSQLLWKYYWDTIEACLPPQDILDVIRRSGFADSGHHSEFGIFSEYTGRKPW